MGEQAGVPQVNTAPGQPANSLPPATDDETFATYVLQTGMASSKQLENAREWQAKEASRGKRPPLADALVLTGAITAEQRDNAQKRTQSQQRGALQKLGPYKLLKKLGAGAMGVVMLGEDSATGKRVALKILHRKLADNAERLSRFRREVRAALNLNHPNIAGAIAVGEEFGHHFYVMEYWEGESLDLPLHRNELFPVERALDIALHVARGLKYAHEAGFVHRDIKPANILLTKEGVAKILDLGLTKDLESAEQSFMTGSGQAIGTPHYISPEQAQGAKEIDGRTDIYSLGATLFQLVTGSTPYTGATSAAVLLKHVSDPVPDPSERRPDLPAPLVLLVQKMMSKKPAERYKNCGELVTAIERVQRGESPYPDPLDDLTLEPETNTAKPHPLSSPAAPLSYLRHSPAIPRKEPASSRHGLLLYGAALVMLALLAVMLLAYFGGAKKEPGRQETSGLANDLQADARAREEALLKERLEQRASEEKQRDAAEEKKRRVEAQRQQDEQRNRDAESARKKEEEAAEAKKKTAELAQQPKREEPGKLDAEQQKKTDEEEAKRLEAVTPAGGGVGGTAKQKEADGELKRGIEALKKTDTDSTAIKKAIEAFANASALYESLKNDSKATECNSYLYWLRKKLTLNDLDNLPRTQQQALQATAARKSTAQVLFDQAQKFEKDRPDDHLLIAIRYFEVADRFKGEETGLKALDFSLKHMQLISQGKIAAEQPAKKSGTDAKLDKQASLADEALIAAVGLAYDAYKKAYQQGVTEWQDKEPKLNAQCWYTVNTLAGPVRRFNQAMYNQGVQNFRNQHQPVLDKLWAKVSDAEETVLRPLRQRLIAKPGDNQAQVEAFRVRKAMEELYPKTPK